MGSRKQSCDTAKISFLPNVYETREEEYPMSHRKPQNDEMLYEEAYAQKRPQSQASQEMSPQTRLPVWIVIEIHDSG